MIAIIASILCLILVLIQWLQPDYFARILDRFRGRVPPGPFSWPLVGVIGINGEAPWETFADWVEKYGPVCSFFYGSEFTIVLSSLESIRKAMQSPVFDGRPVNHFSRKLLHRGTAYGEGESWKRRRKLMVSAMRTIAKAGPEESTLIGTKLQQCALGIVSEFQNHSDSPFDPCSYLLTAGSEVMAHMIFKESLATTDPRFKEMTIRAENVFSVNPNSDIIDIFPWLKAFPPFKQRHEFFTKVHTDLLGLTGSIVAERKVVLERLQKVCHENELADFTDIMLSEQTRALPDNNIADDEIITMAAENFMAGTEDIKVILRWVLFVLVRYPESQRKLYEHVHEVIGSRPATDYDVPHMPFVEAFILETLRFTSFVPFLLPHRVTEDSDFFGFRLPADATVIVNVYAVNVNVDCWGDSDLFRPERFLTAEGKLDVLATKKSLVFGEGRRNCPGQGIATTALSVLLASIVQNLEIHHPKGQPLPPLTRSQGLTSQPPPYEIVVETRH